MEGGDSERKKKGEVGEGRKEEKFELGLCACCTSYSGGRGWRII